MQFHSYSGAVGFKYETMKLILIHKICIALYFNRNTLQYRITAMSIMSSTTVRTIQTTINTNYFSHA